VKTSRHQNVARRKARIERRLRPRTWAAQPRPMYRASNVRYEHSNRIRGLATGGIGAMHCLAQHVGLVEAIDGHVEVLKVHLLRARARNRWNAERLVTRSPVLRGPACGHRDAFVLRIMEHDVSDAMSLSLALNRPERSFGGIIDSRASSFTDGSARV